MEDQIFKKRKRVSEIVILGNFLAVRLLGLGTLTVVIQVQSLVGEPGILQIWRTRFCKSHALAEWESHPLPQQRRQ